VEKLDQGGASSAAGVGGAASNQINSGAASQQHTTSLDEKKQRIHHNIALSEFFKSRQSGNGSDPFDLLSKLKDLQDGSAKASETTFEPPPPLKAHFYSSKFQIVFLRSLS